MTDEEKKIEQQIMPWRFWFSVVFTGFLVVTFALYLPMRFQYRALTDMHGAVMQGREMEHGGAMQAGEHDGAHGLSAYHEAKDVREGLSVDLSVSPEPVQSGTSTQLDFLVNQKPARTPVPADMLETEHTKLMHVIGLRNDMNEFFHIHPTPFSIACNPPPVVFSRKERGSGVAALAEKWCGVHPAPVATSGIFTIQHIFKEPGRYKIWSSVKKDGIVHTFGHPEIDVQGVGEQSRKDISFGRNVVVGDYQVALKLDKPTVKKMETPLSFDVHTLTGQKIEIEPYLGADMHLAIIKDDLTQFIHTHPEGGGHTMSYLENPLLILAAHAHGGDGHAAMPDAGRGIQFHAVFPEAGLYKAFAQFRPKGISLSPDEALTASFWIKVEDKAPAANPKVILFAVSLVLILLLSWGVKRFLSVRA